MFSVIFWSHFFVCFFVGPSDRRVEALHHAPYRALAQSIGHVSREKRNSNSSKRGEVSRRISIVYFLVAMLCALCGNCAWRAPFQELWYGSSRGGNLSILYSWFVEARRFMRVRHVSIILKLQDILRLFRSDLTPNRPWEIAQKGLWRLFIWHPTLLQAPYLPRQWKSLALQPTTTAGCQRSQRTRGLHTRSRRLVK